MARWKARIRLSIRRNWTFFASCYRWGATRQNVSRLAAIRRGRSVSAKTSGEGVVPGEYFFGFYKTRHILLSDSANCTVLPMQSFWHNTGVWQTDGRTDGIAVARTALAMRALRRAVKTSPAIPERPRCAYATINLLSTKMNSMQTSSGLNLSGKRILLHFFASNELALLLSRSGGSHNDRISSLRSTAQHCTSSHTQSLSFSINRS